MFPCSDNNSDHEKPLGPLLKKSSFFHLQLWDNHQNPIIIPKQDDHDPPFFSNFPSPFFDELDLPLNQIILPYHNPATTKAPDRTENNFAKNETAKHCLIKSLKQKEKADSADQPPKRDNLGVVSRKRTGKKDRHSKICTAQGIRDRRMRLSLQIARKFFDLQDMLGYDKASSTIEWLFSKSNKAIRELMMKENNISPQGNNNNNYFNFSVSDNAKSESFLSECEVVSGNNETIKDRLGNGKKSRKIARRPNHNMRESREKARARARWRTREKKMMIKSLEDSSRISADFPASSHYYPNDDDDDEDEDDLQKLGFSNSPLEGVFDQEYLSHDVGTIEKLLGNYSNLSTSNICPQTSDNYNFHQCCIDPNSTFVGSVGNWELLGNTERFNSSTTTHQLFTVINQGSSMAGNSNISVNFSEDAQNFPLFHQ
ncbi:hypothetical protein OROMI_025233 [Orobanche minor]